MGARTVWFALRRFFPELHMILGFSSPIAGGSGRVLLALLVALTWRPRAALAAPASGASTDAPVTTVEAIVAEVLARHPELEFYRAEIAAAKGGRRAAGTPANPELVASVGGKRVEDRGLSDAGLAWSVSVQQTFEWPGRMALRKAVANQDIRLAELGLAQFRVSLASRARLLACRLLGAEEKAAAAAAVAARFRDLREVLVQRDPAGLTPQLETRIIEATELALQRRATGASLEVQAALLELNQLRGLPWTNGVRLAPLTWAFPPAPESDALVMAARTNHFELQMREAELVQQGFRVELARKEGRPAVTLGPYYEQEKAGDREQQAGLSLSIPLPLWNRNQGNAAAAEARRQQSETMLRVAERDLERQVRQAALAYQTKVGEMAKWRPESVEEFRRAAELADRHYRLGAVPIATYVELQKQYLEAVDALLDTRGEALESALELRRLTGWAPGTTGSPTGP